MSSHLSLGLWYPHPGPRVWLTAKANQGSLPVEVMAKLLPKG